MNINILNILKKKKVIKKNNPTNFNNGYKHPLVVLPKK